MKTVKNTEGNVLVVFKGGACLVETRLGKTYVPSQLMKNHQAVLEKGSTVTLACRPNPDDNAPSPYLATEVFSVKAPFKPVLVLGIVRSYDEKSGYGQVDMVGNHPFEQSSCRLFFGSVCDRQGAWPDQGDKLELKVDLYKGRPSVLHFWYGRDVDADVDALLAKLQLKEESQLVAEVVVEVTSPVVETKVETASDAPTAKSKRTRKTKAVKPEADTEAPATVVAEAPLDIAAMAKAGCSAGICGTLGHALAGVKSEGRA